MQQNVRHEARTNNVEAIWNEMAKLNSCEKANGNINERRAGRGGMRVVNE